jgi:hypothetical protein
LKKGPNLSGIDPETGQIASLFHPRIDCWTDHFAIGIATLIPLGIEIRGLTPVGRTTIRVLGFNDEMRQMLRYELWCEGMYTQP